MARVLLRYFGIGFIFCGAASAQLSSVPDSPTSVSIPDSPAAVERLDKAKEKEDQGQWKTAAEYYQDALGRYGRRVLPRKIDKEAEIFQYVGVGERVQERLAKWPAEGLAAYRAEYGQTAADLLAGVTEDDVAGLENVFSNYFITDAGKAAGIRLMNLHLEAGRFFAAAWVGERLLQWHPALEADRGMVLFQTALAFYWGGDSSKAAALLEELKLKHPNETGQIGGKDVVLADALAAALQTAAPKPATQPSDADHWPMFGGVDGRGEISYSSAKPGASLRTISLIPPRVDHLQAVQKLTYEQTDQVDVAAGLANGIMPVVDGAALFFQDGRHIYAVSADGGQPLADWLSTYGAAVAGTYGVDAFGRARGEQLTVTVTPNRVLAILGQMDRQAPLMGLMQTPSVRLVCLDRKNGKVVWTRGTVDLPDVVAPIRLGEFGGTPLVVGEDSVCVVARGGKGDQFEDSYVVCLSLKTGDYQWSTYVGSASRIFDGEIGLEPQNAPEMSLAQGRIFVLSNLGTVAALDAMDGRMIWLDSYPRDVADTPMMLRNRMNGNGPPVANKPWADNPVFVNQGKVFVLPSDGKDLLVYDAANGEEIKRIATDDFEGADVLLGVRGRAVVLTSDKNCYCIDWAGYDRDKPKESILWLSEVTADRLQGQENMVWGRGFLTNDSVFIPTKHRLAQLSWNRSGRLLATYPARGSWPASEEAGNVLVTAQNVIVAGAKQVSIYTDLELLRKQYEQRVAEMPQDVGPRLWFAQVLFSSDANESLKMLDEAIGLTGGFGSLRSGEDRQRIFETSLRFAQQSAAESSAEGAVMAEKCFDRAGAAAESVLEQATYRLARAGYNQNKKDYAGAVKLAQQILSNEAMRRAVVSENSTAGNEAESEIDEAIRADRSAYATVEQAAVVALGAANKTNDPQKLLAVGQEFPNSKAAVDARWAASMAFETLGDHRSAIHTLEQIYATETDKSANVRPLEAIARNFLAMPDGVGPAIDRLTRGVKLADKPQLNQLLVLADGRTIPKESFAEAIAALRQMQASAEAAKLPSFGMGPPKSSRDKVLNTVDAALISNVRTLVVPLRDYSRNDRVVTWSEGVLSIFSAGATTPLATGKVAQEPIGAAWVNGKLLLWSNEHVFLLNEDGPGIWQMDLRGLPSLEAASDADALVDEAPDANAPVAQVGGNQIVIQGGRRFIVGPQARLLLGGVMVQGINPPMPPPVPRVPGGERVLNVRPAGERLVMDTSTGRIVGLDAREGHIVWQSQLANGPIAQVLVNPQFTVARLDNPAGSQLVVLSTTDGHVVGRRKFGPDDSTDQLVNAALSEDGTLVYTLTNRLLLKDLYESWKTPPTDLTIKRDADPPTFSGLKGPDQLLVRAGRVLALYDDGKMVRVQDLAGSDTPGNPLATGADSNQVSMRLVGPQLFILHPKNMARYNLMNADDHRIPVTYDIDFAPRIVEMMLGTDYTMLVDEPIDRGPTLPQFVRLLAYGRFPSKANDPRESGQLQDDPLVSNKEGISKWQRVDGGIYYLSGDQKLHFLAGASKLQ